MSCDSATWEKTGGKEKPEKRRENVSETREPSEHQDWKQVGGSRLDRGKSRLRDPEGEVGCTRRQESHTLVRLYT